MRLFVWERSTEHYNSLSAHFIAALGVLSAGQVNNILNCMQSFKRGWGGGAKRVKTPEPPVSLKMKRQSTASVGSVR